MDDRTAALRLTPVSHETLQRLDVYVALLLKWQKRTNLVAPSTLPTIWTRHISDSLQLLTLAPDARHWLDFGSGGGFPGIVIACALAETSGARIDLVERNAKKVAFLREALRVTAGAGKVHHVDIADCAAAVSPDIDLVTARAVAPLPSLLLLARPWLDRGIRCLFPKGQDAEQEILQSTICGIYAIEKHNSLTGNGQILDVRKTGLQTSKS